MIAINHDRTVDDDERRRAIYAGDLIVDSPTVQAESFCEFTRELIGDAFGQLDPTARNTSSTFRRTSPFSPS